MCPYVRYVVSVDPEDPVYYSTCYVREVSKADAEAVKQTERDRSGTIKQLNSVMDQG